MANIQVGTKSLRHWYLSRRSAPVLHYGTSYFSATCFFYDHNRYMMGQWPGPTLEEGGGSMGLAVLLPSPCMRRISWVSYCFIIALAVLSVQS